MSLCLALLVFVLSVLGISIIKLRAFFVDAWRWSPLYDFVKTCLDSPSLVKMTISSTASGVSANRCVPLILIGDFSDSAFFSGCSCLSWRCVEFLSAELFFPLFHRSCPMLTFFLIFWVLETGRIAFVVRKESLEDFFIFAYLTSAIKSSVI